MEPSTDTLRKLAPSWTLAGDEQLLTLLQNTHKRLVERCNEVNEHLEKMATALDDASIGLQNVNNQFMALSSSQFIESRVYDDDNDVIADIPPTKDPEPLVTPESELASIKKSLSIVERSHEIITILHDSDTESDTDDDSPPRMVLKPKDLYSDRPLPYIIGTLQWKNKWHAGLLVEDSDSDSTTSKPDADSDQYSPEEPDDMPADRHVPARDTTISETSSELPSEPEPPRPSPSDIASHIARRLGTGPPPKMVDPEPEYTEPSKPTVRKVYRPQDPVTSTIFPDEPPPLDSDPDDVFASLHTDAYSQNDADIFSDLQPATPTKPVSIFDAGPPPHMFDKQLGLTHKHSDTDIHTDKSYHEHPAHTVEDRGVKKPVGGISLFGHKGTESIGAAILKRNQRKSFSSDEESEEEAPESKPNEQVKKEKDIFDNLFARSQPKVKPQSKNVIKDITTEIQKKTEPKKEMPKTKKVDLFSDDNLFDDIDDIFITTAPKDKKDTTKPTKSIFDDDDDIFSEIAAPKTVKTDPTSTKKGLFDSDDELFSEIKSKETSNANDNSAKEINKITPSPKVDKIKDTKTKEPSIFDDDEDDIFSDVKSTSKTKIISNTQETNKPKEILKVEQPAFKIPSLFDDNDDDSDIFNTQAKPSIKSKSTNNPVAVVKNESTVVNISSKIDKQTNINEETTKNVDNVKDNLVEPKTKDDISNKEKSSLNNINKEQNLSSVTESKPIAITIPIESKDISKAKSIFDNDSDNGKQSEDDFSEQDFDDLPPKVEISNNTSNAKQIETETEVPPNIFDSSPIEDDIFTNKVDNSRAETLSTNIEKDNNTEIAPNSSINADVFGAIVSEPPIFEKPKEPKKSKNVNALFDDDSDDESLFFKKNDVIFDEIPEDFSTPQEKLFGIFADEPPDFSKMEDDFDDDLFSSVPKTKIPSNKPEIKTISSKAKDSKQDKLSTSSTEQKSNTNISTDYTKSHSTVKDLESSLSDEENLFKLPENKPTLSNILDKSNEEDLSKTIPDTSHSKNFDSEYKVSEDELFRIVSKNLPVTKEPMKDQHDTESNKNSDDDLFTSLPKQKVPLSKNDKNTKTSIDEVLKNALNTNQTSDSELYNSLTEQDVDETEIIKDIKSSDEDLLKKPLPPRNISDEESKTKIETPNSPETKKVGKLKTMGLNINVNALLPGASPKKVKSDQIDGQVQSATSQSPDNESQKTISESPTTISPENETPTHIPKAPELVKAVSFEGESNSSILDNKLSKERAKIQVKRRPSTRRARKEAVRKSAIDFGDETTDNSSSIDDSPRIQPRTDNIDNKTQSDSIVQDKNTEKHIEKEQVEVITSKTDIKNTHNVPEAPKPEIKPIETVQRAENTTEPPKLIEDVGSKVSTSSDVKSKVVYILNDEDIFNTNTEKSKELSPESINTIPKGISTIGGVYKVENDEKLKNNYSKTKDTTTNLFGDDDDDIFKEKLATNDEMLKGKTVSNDDADDIFKGQTSSNANKDIFEVKPTPNDDDDEIFKGKSSSNDDDKIFKDKPSNKSIFDSDSEGELFGKSNKEIKEVTKDKPKDNKEVMKKMTGSLFGDDEDDDDNLFGVKTKKTVNPSPRTSKTSSKEIPKTTEPVFEDPLSMFGDD